MIYYVEDDQNILELVIYSLKALKMEAIGFYNSKTFFEKMNEEVPDLVILDLMLQDESGIDIIKKMKNNTIFNNIPIIILSARNSEIDKVHCLDLGADDYVSKPFGVMELLARIKAVLRRYENKTSSLAVIKSGNIIINPMKHLVLVDSKEINLTNKEYALLKKLMENKNIVLSREKLLEEIWGYDFYGESRTVDMHIKTLRSKLLDAKDRIETIRGVGYKFNAKEDI